MVTCRVKGKKKGGRREGDINRTKCGGLRVKKDKSETIAFLVIAL